MSAFPIDIVGVISRATILLAVAAVADLASRRRASAATRHLIWTMAVARSAPARRLSMR